MQDKKETKLPSTLTPAETTPHPFPILLLLAQALESIVSLEFHKSFRI